MVHCADSCGLFRAMEEQEAWKPDAKAEEGIRAKTASTRALYEENIMGKEEERRGDSCRKSRSVQGCPVFMGFQE